MQLTGVLDAEGYAICPDCDTKINCSKVGLANLEIRHKGTKACRDAAQKRDRAKTQHKNTSILSFLKKRPTPVPPTVALAQLLPVVPSSGSRQACILTGSKDLPNLDLRRKEAAIISELHDLISKLPPTVPEAGPADTLAIFGKDPKSFDNLEMPSEDIWETMMNPTLKSVLGWGNNVDLATVI
ncbi:hypothetical protein DXG01_004676, partial [Tephrocybe rancida]